jgi:phosphoglycolate phosphatase
MTGPTFETSQPEADANMDRPHPYSLIVFDVDGTLVDSQAGIVASMADAFQHVGLGPPSAERTRRVVGLSLDEAVARLLPDGPDDRRLADAVAAYKRAFMAHRQRPDYDEPLFPGARDALAALDHPQVCLGVATGKSRRGLDATLRHHGLAELFVTTQTADDGPGKPHPRMLIEAMRDVGAGAHETLFVGDTVFDMEMAVHAGVTAFGVAWGYHDPEELSHAGARTILRGFDDLRARLEGSTA